MISRAIPRTGSQARMRTIDDPTRRCVDPLCESGFSLIELLVVVMIVGVLAAIALPVFLGQSRKAADAGAKSNARNVAGAIEACHAQTDDYTKCDTEAELLADGSQLSVTYGSAPGEVEVTAPQPDTYTLTAHSRSGNDFTISRSFPASWTRTCSTAANGGCPSGGTW